MTIPVLTLFSYVRVITIPMILTRFLPKTSRCLATFEFLATFKDGHYSKEGHGKSVKGRAPRVSFPLSLAAISSSLLDYTCNASRLAIWGGTQRFYPVMTRLWPLIRFICHNALFYITDLIAAV
jgi:hypothetical protein